MRAPLWSTVSHGDYDVLLGGEEPKGYTPALVRSRSLRLRRSAILFLFSFIICLGFTVKHFRVSARRVDGWQRVPANKVQLPHVYNGIQTTNPVNSTLGFQQILALNLPHRLDKRDELTLMSYASDVKIDFLTTRLLSSLKDVGMPHHAKLEFPGVLGCWRAHVDAWQKIVSNKISTTLILEDDADWSVDIKEQLQNVHQPLATLLKSVSTDDKERVSTSTDPWMHDDWDMLYFGYCYEKPSTKDGHLRGTDPAKPLHVLYDDDTLTNRTSMSQEITEDTPGFSTIVNYMDYHNYTIPTGNETNARRLVARAYNPICLNAYAITLKGAAKLLYSVSREIPFAIDIQVMDLVGNGNITAYEIMPPLMDQWKIKDSKLKSSDNKLSAVGDKYIIETSDTLNHNPSNGTSLYVRNSLRRSLRDVLMTM